MSYRLSERNTNELNRWTLMECLMFIVYVTDNHSQIAEEAESFATNEIHKED